MDGDGDLSGENSKEELGTFLTGRRQEGSRKLPLLPTDYSNGENLEMEKKKNFCNFNIDELF